MSADALGGLVFLCGLGAVLTGVFGGRVIGERLLRLHFRRAHGMSPLDARVTAELVIAGMVEPPARRRPARPLPPASGRSWFVRGGSS
ncbi:hypothetical protein [Kutzneria sp. NPDC051319]|uniref:hypothetical protein n=1 Tax=Kutzneria sp. NPDC051319 TaxID=3155047 RepID=UPI0034300061